MNHPPCHWMMLGPVHEQLSDHPEMQDSQKGTWGSGLPATAILFSLNTVYPKTERDNRLQV